MKFAGFIGTAAVLFAGLSSAQAVTCFQADGGSEGYTIQINVSDTDLEIRQTSRLARYGMIKEKVQKVDFSKVVDAATADFACEQTTGGISNLRGKVTQILVKGDVVQVLQSSPAALYAPLEYRIVRKDANGGTLCEQLLAQGIVTPECSLPK